jgi:hypothetical protein
VSLQNENVRFEQSRNVRSHGWPSATETERIALNQRERNRLRVLHQKRRSGSRRATLIVSSRLSYIAMRSAVYKTHTYTAGESWRVNSRAGLHQEIDFCLTTDYCRNHSFPNESSSESRLPHFSHTFPPARTAFEGCECSGEGRIQRS